MNYTKLKLLLICISIPVMNLQYEIMVNSSITRTILSCFLALLFSFHFYNKGDVAIKWLYILNFVSHIIFHIGSFLTNSVTSPTVAMHLCITICSVYCIYLLVIPNKVLILLKEKQK